MKLKFIKLSFLLSIVVLISGLTAANAQKTANQVSPADQRQIIETLLKEKLSGSPEQTIYLSTANLSAEIQENLTNIDGKKIEFIAAENAAQSGVCAYEFGGFVKDGKFVSVSFGNCREGLTYDFKKSGGKWKGSAYILTN